MKSVLYIGCPASERADTEQLFGSVDFSVVWADSAAYALNELEKQDMPVLLDLARGAAVLQIATDMRVRRGDTLMFAVVDPRRPDLTTEAVLSGMADVFARPLGARRVANAIERELGYVAGEKRCAVDACREDLYTQSAAMRDVMTQVARAAAMRAGVLIRGEEGTGRQVVSRAIHVAGGAPTDAFVCIDCAAHDTDQLDADLFGSAARGQNGDASRGLERVSRDSRLHDAHGGTLYLQNVAEAPTRLQARLARVLRDREAVLVETGATIGLDVRPMAGVDMGFDSAVQEGRIREELFRRLAVLRIDVPPLRMRREDIPALANYFVRSICGTQGIPPKTLSRPALSLIAALPWRGNAVELRTLLETVVSDRPAGRGIGLEDILAHVRLDGGSTVFSNAGTLRQARARFEREYIGAVLERNHGSINDAANALGIQRTNLYRKMRSLRVSRERR